MKRFLVLALCFFCSFCGELSHPGQCTKMNSALADEVRHLYVEYELADGTIDATLLTVTAPQMPEGRGVIEVPLGTDVTGKKVDLNTLELIPAQ